MSVDGVRQKRNFSHWDWLARNLKYQVKVLCNAVVFTQLSQEIANELGRFSIKDISKLTSATCNWKHVRHRVLVDWSCDGSGLKCYFGHGVSWRGNTCNVVWHDALGCTQIRFNKKQTKKTHEAEPFYICSPTANASSMQALWTTWTASSGVHLVCIVWVRRSERVWAASANHSLCIC